MTSRTFANPDVKLPNRKRNRTQQVVIGDAICLLVTKSSISFPVEIQELIVVVKFDFQSHFTTIPIKRRTIIKARVQ